MFLPQKDLFHYSFTIKKARNILNVGRILFTIHLLSKRPGRGAWDFINGGGLFTSIIIDISIISSRSSTTTTTTTITSYIITITIIILRSDNMQRKRFRASAPPRQGLFSGTFTITITITIVIITSTITITEAKNKTHKNPNTQLK